jgi:Flp pilus assembly protein CpaB
MLYNIKLIAIGEDIGEVSEEKEKSGKSSSNVIVTLAVTPSQAQELQLALQKGSVQLTLRNPTDKTTNEVDPTILNDSKFVGDIMDLIGESGSETGEKTGKNESQINGREVEESKSKSRDSLKVDEPKTRKRRFWKVDMILGQKKKEVNFPIEEDSNE